MAALLAACGSTAPPHSEYFVIEFLPGTPAPSGAGVDALGAAVADAKRAPPARIVIEGAKPADGVEPVIERQRTEAVFAAFARGGVDTKRIEVRLLPTTPQGYAQRRDSLIVRLGY
ncbi:MAG: hypothetical protein ACREFQ_20740 [Stellaceae bacterium]